MDLRSLTSYFNMEHNEPLPLAAEEIRLRKTNENVLETCKNFENNVICNNKTSIGEWLTDEQVNIEKKEKEKKQVLKNNFLTLMESFDKKRKQENDTKTSNKKNFKNVSDVKTLKDKKRKCQTPIKINEKNNISKKNNLTASSKNKSLKKPEKTKVLTHIIHALNHEINNFSSPTSRFNKSKYYLGRKMYTQVGNIILGGSKKCFSYEGLILSRDAETLSNTENIESFNFILHNTDILPLYHALKCIMSINIKNN